MTQTAADDSKPETGKPDAASKRPDKFRCHVLDREVIVRACVEGFVDANALNKTDSPCFRCAQGAKVRDIFANY
jgi:hypothetical protein